MNSYTDELAELVGEAAYDIVHDCTADYPSGLKIGSVEVYEKRSGEDGDGVYGEYLIWVNGGRFTVEIAASASCRGNVDCWDWSTESHYTREVFFDALRDFEYRLVGFTEDNGRALDKMVDADIESKGRRDYE